MENKELKKRLQKLAGITTENKINKDDEFLNEGKQIGLLYKNRFWL